MNTANVIWTLNHTAACGKLDETPSELWVFPLAQILNARQAKCCHFILVHQHGNLRAITVHTMYGRQKLRRVDCVLQSESAVKRLRSGWGWRFHSDSDIRCDLSLSGSVTTLLVSILNTVCAVIYDESC